MKKILSVIFVSLILFISGCSVHDVNLENAANDKPKATINDYVDADKLHNIFGFTNETGNLIITIDPVDVNKDIKSINKAIGENGNVLSIKYLKNQSGNSNDNGRQLAFNFDNLEGHIFEVIQGKAKADETYYLVNDNEFNLRSILKSTEGDETEIDSEAKKEIERTKNRRIQNSWEIGRIDLNMKIYLVMFERQNDDMLMSIVMETPTKLVYKDYPAKYDEASTWRVDDGGEVVPWMFSMLFAAKAEDGIIIGLKWIAPEGESTYFLKENGDKLEELDISTGRYMVPI